MAGGRGGDALPTDKQYEDLIKKFYALSDRICSVRASMQQYVLQTRDAATSGVKMSDEFSAFFDDRSHPTFSFCMRFREFMKQMQAYCDTWSESLKATSFNPIEEYLETTEEFTKRIAERKRLMRKFEHYTKRVQHLEESPKGTDVVHLEQYVRKVESTREKFEEYTGRLRGDLQEFLASRFDFLSVPVERIYQSVCSHTDMASDNIKKVGSFPVIAPPKRDKESSGSEDEVREYIGTGGDVGGTASPPSPAIEIPGVDVGGRDRRKGRGSGVFRRVPSGLGRSPRRSSSMSSGDRDDLDVQFSSGGGSPQLDVTGLEVHGRSDRSDSFDFHPLPQVQEEEAEALVSPLDQRTSSPSGIEGTLFPASAQGQRDRAVSLEDVSALPGRRRSSSPPSTPTESGRGGMRRSQTSVGLNRHLEPAFSPGPTYSPASAASPSGLSPVEAAAAAFGDLELIDVLEDPVSSNVFKNFCVQEFCQENVLFWLDVKYFQSMTNPSMIQKLIPKILSKYISIGASEQINISDMHRCEIERRIRASEDTENPVPLGRDLFDDAQKEVYTMMCSDMFKRFLKSVLYRDYVSSKAPRALRTRRYSYDWFSKSSPALDLPKS